MDPSLCSCLCHGFGARGHCGCARPVELLSAVTNCWLARVAAFGLGDDLGFDRIEINKPRFEEGLRHGFEGLVDAAVEVDLCVEDLKHISNFSGQGVALTATQT
jgi:hypothetical protein